jgi:hypothetical protein
MSNLQRFNSQLENMLDDLIRIFPDAKSIRVYKEKFTLAKSANPQIVLLVFLKYVYPYKQQVINKEESFFLSDNLTNKIVNNDELKEEAEADSEYILTQALGIKNLWKKMSEEQKETLWTYFKVLMVLCERYVQEVSK